MIIVELLLSYLEPLFGQSTITHLLLVLANASSSLLLWRNVIYNRTLRAWRINTFLLPNGG